VVIKPAIEIGNGISEVIELALAKETELLVIIVIGTKADQLIGELALFPALDIRETKLESIEFSGKFDAIDEILGIVTGIVGHIAPAKEGQTERSQLPGFQIGTPRMEIRDNQYATNFGDPTVGDEEAYSRALLIIPIERPLTPLSVKTFLPILLIMACAALVLFIRPAYIEARVGLGITALLTLVALQLAGGSSLPDVDYLTMVAKVYLASYVFIMLVLLRVVRASWRHEQGGERGIAMADRAWLFLILIAYFAALGTVGLQSMSA